MSQSPRRPGLVSQLRSKLWKPSVEEEVDSELAFHVEMRVRELVARGLPEPEARAEALRRFGDVERVRAECTTEGRGRDRAVARDRWLAAAAQDARYAVRQLRKAPGFTLVAALTLALGIGATSALFSLAWAVALAPLPYVDTGRDVLFSAWWAGPNPGRNNLSAGNFNDWHARATHFTHLAAKHDTGFNLASDGDAPERVKGARVSRGYFEVFGARALHGRTFVPEEDAPGASHVVVLSHALWKRRFGGDPAAVGRTLRMNGEAYTVVGVMPRDFDPTLEAPAVWVPLALTAAQRAEHDGHFLWGFGRLRPGVTLAQAQAELEAAAAETARTHPETNRHMTARLFPLADDVLGPQRPRMVMLLGAVALVLLIACGNVGNLLLTRGTGRSRELAVRAALGAGRGRIVRQLLTESVVLGALGGALGLALAAGLVRVLVAVSPPDVPRLEGAGLDGTVLAFTALVTLGASLAFGLAPALRAARTGLHATLQHGAVRAGGARDWTRGALVVAEVALALVLLVGAGLLVRTALHLQAVDPGYRPHGLLTARLALPERDYPTPAAAAQGFLRVLERVQATPGVAHASVVTQAPLTEGQNGNGLFPEGAPEDVKSVVSAMLRVATEDHPRALGVPLVRGRFFTPADAAGAPRVMVLSESAARALFPGQDAVGRRVACCEDGEAEWKTVVGVLADVRQHGPAKDAQNEFYLPLAQAPDVTWMWNDRTLTLVVRAGEGVDPVALVPALREAVRAVDPALPLYDVATAEQLLHRATAPSQFLLRLIGLLGLVGLVLSAVGVYGVVSYGVGQRTREIGVRMALGATARSVLTMTARDGLRPVLLGVGLGLALSLALTRVLESALRGVRPTDPLTYAAVAVVLLGVALAAVLVPARRAARVDPARALHAE